MYDSDASSYDNPHRISRPSLPMSRDSFDSSALGGRSPDNAEVLASRYSISVVELKRMYMIWPLIKGLAEWRRDDPSSTPTDLADLISTLCKYHPNLRLSPDTDGYLATFVEAKNEDITLEKLLTTKHAWDPLVARLTIRRTQQKEGIGINRQAMQRRSTNFAVPEDFGISELMKKLVLSANCIESAVRHQDVEKLDVESEKLTVLAENFVLQLEDASRFILEAKSTQNDASKEQSERLKEEAQKHAERVQMMENMMKDSEETVAALQDDLTDAQQRIHELTEELESNKEAGEEAQVERQRLLLAQTAGDKESLEHYMQQAELEKKKRAAVTITYRLQKYILNKNLEASGEEIDRLEKRLYDSKVSADEINKYKAALTEDNERLRDEVDKLNEKVDGLVSYVKELQENARKSIVELDDIASIGSPKGTAGVALIDELGGQMLDDRAIAYSQALEKTKDVYMNTLVIASMNVAVARERQNIANAIRNEGDAETRLWLLPRLLAAGWATKDVAELIKWRLGITYRCVRQSRRRSVNIDECSTDAGSDEFGSARGSGAEHRSDDLGSRGGSGPEHRNGVFGSVHGSGAEHRSNDFGSRRGSDGSPTSGLGSRRESVRRFGSGLADLRHAVERTRDHAEWVKSGRDSVLGFGSKRDSGQRVRDDSRHGVGSGRPSAHSRFE
eukprot:GEMP01011297.1.p1 GENE.GEMP01011297.1~~GEMP01011297.1.p1  ORF type:complete len:677 (+),score=168.57 GEMP01011297.1:196-2226(+)